MDVGVKRSDEAVWMDVLSDKGGAGIGRVENGIGFAPQSDEEGRRRDEAWDEKEGGKGDVEETGVRLGWIDTSPAPSYMTSLDPRHDARSLG
jgi:hypothetical protein